MAASGLDQAGDPVPLEGTAHGERVPAFRIGPTQPVEGSLMKDDVVAYIDAIDVDHRPLFDRVHRLVMEVQPDARVVLSYKMPTYVAGNRQLHVGVWKHGLSFYGWKHDLVLQP